ncbi:P-loop containing nucleoside triphosphate hydrolase protein [Hesseltinella vesiculosa]|uniref:P-loop containing nucleoside triphosphate hydrolase protein n=1 Tax=Hesseltinella vesiculosa TaxID=101127 RepID=A0A1X2G3C2_9FUNG|nr:P-loop containing nucleoside triphosphate hydrolase protein [Hesseltinella vesiculosa]
MDLPSNSGQKRSINYFDLDDGIDDDDELIFDEMGEDTFAGLDDYIQEQERWQQMNDLKSSTVSSSKNDIHASMILDQELVYPLDDDDDDNIELFDASMDHTTSIPVSTFARGHQASMAMANTSKKAGTANPSLSSPLPAKEQGYDYSRPPATGNFLTATCPQTGKPIYIPTQLRAKARKPAPLLNYCLNKDTRLLSKPIHTMMNDLKVTDMTAHAEAQRERRKQVKGKSKKKRTIDPEAQLLWVEKYRPSIFMDLLGDQRVNREALAWVKQWDYCVFGRRPQVESQRDKALRQYQSTFGKVSNAANLNANAKRPENNDPLLRPDQKILLLSGPPGYGKTTLAHVIAKHAGYNIVEVNASDDRTGEVVNTKIKSALEMQAIMRKPNEDGSKGTTMYTKPNLLIIDEIDGASSSGGADSFIRQLVDMASAEVKKDNQASSRRGRKKERQPLLRPIICVCNDAYAPVLRPLRAVATHIQFRRVPALNVAKRLDFICQNEGLSTDLRTLSLLCEMTDGDMRSCLNTLQFIRSKSSSLDKEMLAKNQGTLGKKDVGQSLFATWNTLFSAGKSRQLYKRQRQDRFVDHLALTINNSGDVDKVLQGCFEAYPLMKFHDESLSKLVAIGDWMDFYDHLQHRTFSMHDYSMMGYMPYVAVNYHRYFAGAVIQDHRMEYPRMDYEMFAKKKSYENLMSIFMTGIHPYQRRFLTSEQLALVVIPRLLRILSPDLKPVNKHLIKPQEKAVLENLVNTMLEYGLTFIQESNSDGQFSFRLEPPMEEMVLFEHLHRKSILTSRYAVRQLVAQEIETERLRRRESAMGPKPTKKEDAPMTNEPVSSKATTKKIATDFFGRRIESKEKAADEVSPMGVDEPNLQIQYRYHEGFSNAVRKPMPMNLFL